jgi:hypothetical protein
VLPHLVATRPAAFPGELVALAGPGGKAGSTQTIECTRPDYADVGVRELLDGQEVKDLPDWARESVDRDDSIAISFPGEHRIARTCSLR